MASTLTAEISEINEVAKKLNEKGRWVALQQMSALQRVKEYSMQGCGEAIKETRLWAAGCDTPVKKPLYSEAKIIPFPGVSLNPWQWFSKYA